VISWKPRQIRRKEKLMYPAHNSRLNPRVSLRPCPREPICRGLHYSSELLLVLEAGLDPVFELLVQAVHLLEDLVIA
jgi:hypothetical protein